MSEINEKPSTPLGQAFENLKVILANQDHLFACSGAIPISNQPRPVPECTPGPDEQITSPPVTIRWDTSSKDSPESEQDACAKITLPIKPGHEARLDRLVRHAQPATFGRGGEDVLDESYRKALKVDTNAFCSTFDPYSLGIIDTIAQVLLPSAIDSLTHRSVRAELYKLNVYSGPSGMFKSHVDTPRSSSQFGSLVVCLPAEHDGGQLKVRHKGKEITYDWSNQPNGPDLGQIQWAAFYSDCEHEILEVTQGHRVTLTYNLYAVRGVGRLTGMSQTLDPTRLPLYQAVQTAVGKHREHFNDKGATVVFWCSHVYAYNHPSSTPLPDTLKGIDAVIWEIFQSLGLRPRINAVIKWDNDDRHIENLQYDYEYAKARPEEGSDALRHWEAERPGPWVEGPFGLYNSPRSQIRNDDEYVEMYTGDSGWGGRFNNEPKIWLNGAPSHKELQLVYTAYGNEAKSACAYSHCAILADIIPQQKDTIAEKTSGEVGDSQRP